MIGKSCQSIAIGDQLGAPNFPVTRRFGIGCAGEIGAPQGYLTLVVAGVAGVVLGTAAGSPPGTPPHSRTARE